MLIVKKTRPDKMIMMFPYYPDSELSGFSSIHKDSGVIWDESDAEYELSGSLAPVDTLGSSATTSEGCALSVGYSRGVSNENVFASGLNCILGDSDNRLENMKVVFKGRDGLTALQNFGNTCLMIKIVPEGAKGLAGLENFGKTCLMNQIVFEETKGLASLENLGNTCLMNEIVPGETKGLANLENLENTCLMNEIVLEETKGLAGLENLRNTCLMNEIVPEGTTGLANLENLGNTCLMNEIVPEGTTGLANLENLGNTCLMNETVPEETKELSGLENLGNTCLMNEIVPEGTKGLAGLENLGNTCFMNSALQCLVHTPQLVEYFLQSFTHDINSDNPLGTNGQLALAFGSLLRELWCSGNKPVAPYEFKEKLGLFASQFCGYDQHDSQEFLAYLLDGLHEDLNLVKQKPYIQAKDNDGRPDREVADELWRYHKARNDSVFVDTCQGQYKSTLSCPVCEKKSTTFDPFMYLSLPLRSRETRKMAVTVFYGEGSSLARKYTVSVPENGCCIDLQNALGATCCIKDDEYLLLAEVFPHRIHRYFEIPTELLTSINYFHCIVAYILPKRASGLTRLEICHSSLERTTWNTRGSTRCLFLTPLVTFLEDPQSGGDIDLAVSRILSPLRRKPSFTPTEENDNKCTTYDGQGIVSIGRKGSEETEKSEMSFKIFIMNDDSINSTPIKKDITIGPGQILKVVLDWFQEDEELHDIRCLVGIPMVYQINYFEKKAEESISLFSCLDAFMKQEPLGADNMWYCSHCKEHRRATKKLDLWMLPDILVFNLKRFSYCRGSDDKIDAFVDFPTKSLDLSKYVQCNDASGKSHIYDLYAISNHYGELSCGHYTAYCKGNDEKWYLFDDANVSPVKEVEVKSSNAYLLFYKRVDVGIDATHSNGEVKSFDASIFNKRVDANNSNGEVKSFDASMFNKRVDVVIDAKHSNGEAGWLDYVG